MNGRKEVRLDVSIEVGIENRKGVYGLLHLKKDRQDIKQRRRCCCLSNGDYDRACD